MKLEKLAEIIQSFYYSGRINASNLTLGKSDFLEYAKMGYAQMMRQLYYASKQMQDGNEYYYYSNAIRTEIFDVPEKDQRGRSRIDFTEKPMIFLPKNQHIINIMPVGEGCGWDDPLDISQIEPGEEKFYIGAAFESFPFMVIKGDYMDIYNLPECTKKIEVEAIYDNDDIDIPLDIGYDIANDILGNYLKIKGFPVKSDNNPYNPVGQELKERITENG